MPNGKVIELLESGNETLRTAVVKPDGESGIVYVRESADAPLSVDVAIKYITDVQGAVADSYQIIDA